MVADREDTQAAPGVVVSVFGPFASRALIDVPASFAAHLFGDAALAGAGPCRVLDALQRDIDELPINLASSALAAMALALGFEIEHPYNSATAKSMCAGRLMDALATLRELAPEPEEGDGLDRLRSAFAGADSGGAAA